MTTCYTCGAGTGASRSVERLLVLRAKGARMVAMEELRREEISYACELVPPAAFPLRCGEEMAVRPGTASIHDHDHGGD